MLELLGAERLELSPTGFGEIPENVSMSALNRA
jgi:hypothetical protein